MPIFQYTMSGIQLILVVVAFEYQSTVVRYIFAIQMLLNHHIVKVLSPKKDIDDQQQRHYQT